MDPIINIIKRDGTKEPYKSSNITRVIKAAGLNNDEAAKVTENITSWIISLSKNEISSLQIRDQVLQELKKVKEDAANLFAWYQSTKESN